MHIKVRSAENINKKEEEASFNDSHTVLNQQTCYVVEIVLVCVYCAPHALTHCPWFTPKHGNNEVLITLSDPSKLLLLIQGGFWWDLFYVFTARRDEKDKVDNESSRASTELIV